MSRPITEHLFIDGPSGPLEARWDHPPSFRGTARAIICHPHPLYGGSLTNKVVHTLALTLVEAGIPALRFNFRGVGKSAGTFDQGQGETDDLLAVIDHLFDEAPETGVWLGGFSFGAYVALRACRKRPVERLITVAPPVNLFDCEDLDPPPLPWLLIQGEADEIVPCQAVLDWAGQRSHPPRIACLSGAGHFFHRRLSELRQTLLETWAA